MNPTPFDIFGLFVLGAIYGWACMLFGAWLHYRGRSGASPLPSLPVSAPAPKEDPKALQLPKVKP